VCADVPAAPPGARNLLVARRAHSLTSYDLLLCGLLGLVAAGRLWLVAGYFRADTWLALVAGRDIWSQGIPHRETLTAAAAGQHWIDQQWGGHLLMYAGYRAGGFALVALGSVVLAVGTFAAVTVAARARARGRTVLLLMPLTLFPFFAQSWQPRTQALAYPLFAAVFLLLLHDSRRPSNRVLLALPLVAIWGNLHGSAILGAALVMLQGCLLLRNPAITVRARAIALIAGPPVLLMATPYGTATAHYYRATLLNRSFTRLAGEWQPIWHDLVLVVPFACVVALTVWVLVHGRGKATLWERLALVLLLIAAASALRNMVWLSLAALPVLSAGLDRVVPADSSPSPSAHVFNRMLVALSGVALVAAVAVTAARPTADFERDYPHAYLHAIRKAAALDPSARIVADVEDADWLLWRDPDLRGRIAFDARLELLSAARVRDVASMLGGSADSPLRGADYRIFALNRHPAAAMVANLEGMRGRRVLFADDRHIVMLLSARG
jgi:hypothetical protein